RVRDPRCASRDHVRWRGGGPGAGPHDGGLVSDVVATPDEKRPLLVFLNEVAGGRRLLQAVRDRTAQGDISQVIVTAPQNQPSIGTLIDRDELYASARARVEVTMSILANFG